jgi:outer membrane protein assembly factor BamB
MAFGPDSIVTTRRRLARGIVVVAAACGMSFGAATAADVTIGLVVKQAGGEKPLDALQEAWRSPIGGWVVATAPFGVKIADKPILEFRTAAEKIAAESEKGAGDAAADELVEKLDGDATDGGKRSADPKAFRFDRPASAVVSVGEGKRSIAPFDISFEVAEDGVRPSNDPRLRIDAARRRIDLICHPVSIRTVTTGNTAMGGRTVTAPLEVVVGGRSLLGNLPAVLGEYERLAEPWRESAGKVERPGFSELTLFLPATADGGFYEVAGRRFMVGSDGTISLDPAAKAAHVDGRTILLDATAPAVASTRPVAVQVWNLPAPARITATGGGAADLSAGSAAAAIAVPVQGPATLSIDRLSVKLPAAGPEWPHAIVLWDVAANTAWSIESAALLAKPGGEWRCRIVNLIGKGSIGRELAVRIEPSDGRPLAARAAPVEPTMLAVDSEGVGTARLPKGNGLHRIVATGKSPLAGRTLAYAWLAEKAPAGSLSLFTVNNRGLVRRGDKVDLLFAAGGTRPLPEMPVVLRGMGVEKEIGRITGRSGGIRLDTTPLAAGDYEVTAAVSGDVAVYPLRLRLAQQEPRSDYTLYSYVYGPAKPMGGSPVNAYYGGGVAGDPGLEPFLGDVDAAADPVLGAYASAPAGPAAEKCRPLPAEEASVLAVASLGGTSVPTPPQMLHHEEWNPKHTLPEELAEMRRRLALFTQPRADVAGFAGYALNWYATLTGYWEESPQLDGHQAARNAAAAKWIGEKVEKRMAEARSAGASEKQIEAMKGLANLEAASSVLPAAYAEWLADARAIRPDLTSHTGIPDFWLGKGSSFPPAAYTTLSHRDAVDYTDYGIAPWGNFRAPAFLGMGNQAGQKTRCSYMTTSRHSRVATAFGAAGRGLDGLSLTLADEYPTGEDAALLQILERFGPFFSALEPMPDVGVYYSGWAEQASVILHDLARMRRPGVLLSQSDVRAGKLAGLKVLVLAAIGEGQPTDILKAFEKFAADGGAILKDGNTAASLPGRPLGFTYDKTQVHNGWGLAYPNGEWEFAHLWDNFKKTREAPLVAAFNAAAASPVSTPTPDVVVSPLAGSESILCFSINQTLVPLEVQGKWRQHAVLPRTSTLLVEKGWHVHDLLAGKPVAVADTPEGRGVPLDFTRCEGAIHLLTRRVPESLAIRTERSGPHSLKLAAWLADAKASPLPDPLPFEVTLRDEEKRTLFHAFVAASPTLAVDVPVPAAAAKLELVVRDLVLGCEAIQPVEPAAAATILPADTGDLVGGSDAIGEFLAGRTGPVTILLDEGQETLRPAAEAMAQLLASKDRASKVVVLDPARVRPLPLRWVPRADDELARELVRSGGLAWRIGLRGFPTKDGKAIDFGHPASGYDEYGPRLVCDTDVVLFGLPETHRGIAELAPYLRRRPTANVPAAEEFFVERLRSPFQGGRDGLLVACRDPAGGLEAVERLASLGGKTAAAAKPGAPVSPASKPVETKGGRPAKLDEMAAQAVDMIIGRFGTRVLDAAFTPDGRIFVTADSYGDSFFVVDAAGKVMASKPLGNRCGNMVWSQAGGKLSDVTADGFTVTYGSLPCRYDLARGFVSHIPAGTTGFTGRFKVPIAASTALDDGPRGRRFVGGSRRMQCLDTKSGKLLWTFDDTALRTGEPDLLYLRSTFPRAVTTDGRQLLVAGFAIQHDTYGIGKAVNASILALDAATGKLLWQQDGVLLNDGKVIPLDGRFLVIDDTGTGRVITAADGQVKATLAAVQGTDWILPVPGREEILIVENNAFDREGRAARVYLRPFQGGADRPIAVAGRITDVHVAADGGSITCATERGVTQRFAADGSLLWEAITPTGGIVRPSGDGSRLFVGCREGVAHMLDAKSGKRLWSLDFNPFNVTSGERFIAQTKIGELPADAGLSPPVDPPEPSWLAASPAPGVTFGKPLVDRKAAGKGEKVSFPVERGKTYLVELLAACEAAGRTPFTRLEIEVAGVRADEKAGPFRCLLPLDDKPARRRVAFRAERSGSASLVVRAVEPATVGDGRAAKKTYDKPVASQARHAVDDTVVAEMRFTGRDIVFDGGPKSGSRPLGDFVCTVKPWTGGNSTIRHEPYPCPAAAVRMANGRLDDPNAVWTKEARADGILKAEARVKLAKPQTVSAVAVYEDASGPVPTGAAAVETTTPRFAVFAREAKTGRWRRLGVKFDNVNFVNVFAGSDVPVDEILYVWASREETTIDGFVRPTEIEIYAGDDLEAVLDEPVAEDDPLGL